MSILDAMFWLDVDLHVVEGGDEKQSLQSSSYV